MTPTLTGLRRTLRRAPLVALIPLAALMLLLATGPGPLRAAAAPETVLNRGLDATLVVLSDDDDAAFLGSAVLWGDGTVIVTADHVLKGRRRVLVQDRHGRFVSAEVTARDPVRDIAILRIDEPVFGKGLTPADVLPGLGDEVYAIGAPLEIEYTVTRGIVSATARQVEAHVPVLLIQHDAAMNPGSSGGALIGSDGRLYGINTRIADGSRLFAGISYAIPAQVIARFIAGELAPVRDLGLTVRPVTARIARALGLDTAAGVLVDDVAQGGRGWRSGVEPGDVLISLDGQPIRRPGDLSLLLAGVSGDKAQLVIRRDGAEVSLLLDLTDTTPRLSLSDGARMAAKVDHYTWEKLGIFLDDAGRRVVRVSRSSPAYRAGLADGDEIVAVNGEPVREGVMPDTRIDGPVLLLVRRNGGRTMHVMVDPWTNVLPDVPLGGANALDPAVSVF